MPSEHPPSTRTIVTSDVHAPLVAQMRLLVVEGASSRVVELPPEGALVFGRGDGVDVRLADQSVSRRHVEIASRGGAVTVEDLGSHNGSKLNGDWLRGKRPLRPGDVVVLGESALVLQSAAPPAARAEEAALADIEAFGARLAAEVKRALEYDRPLAVAALVVDEDAADARALAARAALEAARGIDVAAWEAERRLVLMLPEQGGDEAAAELRDVLAAVAPRAARAGVAVFPDDGTRADVLLSTARAAAALAGKGEVARGEATVKRLAGVGAIVADPAMERLYDLVARLAPSDLPVLVAGETGAGKDLVASALHRLSPRKERPLVALNCAAIPESLAESELFGHEVGAFSGAVRAHPGHFERAHGGTLFLDEVGELSPALQSKLLRALETKRVMRVGGVQEREVDVRLVAATHRDLGAQVKEGRFRQDLFFRLAAATVQVPPLRDRPRDVAVMARAFLDAIRESLGRPKMTIGGAAMNALTTRPWPGNVRELKNVLEYAAVTAEGAVLEPWHLPTGAAEGASTPPAATTSAPPRAGSELRPIGDEIRELEKMRMQQALDAAAGNQTRAAALIAMPLRTFVTKLKVYGLSRG